MTHPNVKLDYFWIDENGDTHCECISCTENGLILNGLPVYVADDDFIEHLAEMGYGNSIESVEMYEEWDIWEKENVI
jgi:hypothetical protein